MNKLQLIYWGPLAVLLISASGLILISIIFPELKGWTQTWTIGQNLSTIFTLIAYTSIGIIFGKVLGFYEARIVERKPE